MDNRRYEVPGRPELFVYSQSSIKSFAVCPRQYQFEVEFGQEVSDIIGAQSNVRQGSILERMVLGDYDGKLGLVVKDGQMVEYEKGSGTLAGSIHDKTMRGLWNTAQPARKRYFKEEQLEGNRQIKMISVIDDEVRKRLGMDPNGFVYAVGSELDFRGEYLYEDVMTSKWLDDAIVDLKVTSNIEYSMYGDDAFSKVERIQAVMYSMQVWLSEDKILPFVYALIEAKRAKSEPIQKDVTPIVKPFLFNTTLDSYRWLISYIDEIHNMSHFPMTPSPYKCVGAGNRNIRCRFYLNCPGARTQIMSTAGEYDFDSLPDIPVYE